MQVVEDFAKLDATSNNKNNNNNNNKKKKKKKKSSKKKKGNNNNQRHKVKGNFVLQAAPGCHIIHDNKPPNWIVGIDTFAPEDFGLTVDNEDQMPDISIVYSLMEERGKDINLYDWFQSFVTIVDENIDDKTYLDLTDGNSSGTSGKKKKKRIGTRKKSQDAAELLKKLTDDLDKSVKNVDLQARFVTAVSDLQYLGCIRPHHKKADHVTRLIFGM